MTERDMQALFGKYVKKYPPKESETYELKFSAKGLIAFDQVSEHQIESLKAAEEGGLYHRITDQPWIENRPYAYTLKKPFDCFFLNKVKSYVAILFYTPRKDKIVYLIRIDNFLKMKEKSERKSFTEETANRFSSKVYLI